MSFFLSRLMLRIVLLFLGHKYPVVYINCVIYALKKSKNPKFKFTNERLTYFIKFTIQHVIYVGVTKNVY